MENIMEQMNFLKYIFFIFLPTLLFSQEYTLERDVDWTKYSKITETHYSILTDLIYRREYYLNKGNVENIKDYIKDSLVKSHQIENKIDTLYHQFNSQNLLESDEDFHYFYNNLGQVTERRDKESISNSTHYDYNEEGLIEREFSSYFNGSRGKLFKHIIWFKYDECRNLVEEKSKEIEVESPSSELPNDYSKGANINNFEYEYNNDDCIWTKKTLIEDNKIIWWIERNLE